MPRDWTPGTPRAGHYAPESEGLTVAVYGNGGSGKTRFAARLLSTRTEHTRVVALDPEGDVFKYLARDPAIRARIVETPKRNSDVKPGQIVIVDTIDEFVDFTHRIRDTLVYVDEADVLFSQAILTSKDGRPAELIRTCRNRGVELVFASQRPYDVGPRVRSRAEWTYALRAGNELYIDALRELGTREVWAECSALPKGQALVFGPDRPAMDTPLPSMDVHTDDIPHRMSAKDRLAFVAPP